MTQIDTTSPTPVQQPISGTALDETRRGTFKISAPLLMDLPDVAKYIMGRCVIVRAEQLFMEHAVQYWAYSDAFDSVPLGVEAPEYLVLIDTIGGPGFGYEVKFTRITPE